MARNRRDKEPARTVAGGRSVSQRSGESGKEFELRVDIGNFARRWRQRRRRGEGAGLGVEL